MAGNPKSSSTGRNWANLHFDLLQKILLMLNTMDLLSVAQVCSSWRKATSDSSLWNTLHVSQLHACLSTTRHAANTGSEQELIRRLMRMLNRALYLGGGCISRLILHVHAYTTNEHLIWIAKRSPNLKQLILPSWNMLTLQAFDEAMQNWKGLESLTVPCPWYRDEFMRIISTRCQNFFELKLLCPFDLDFAMCIADYTPRLKVLSFQAALVYKEALVYILDKMEGLEVLNISHCLLMVDPDSPDYFMIQTLDESIIAKASRLKKFLFCDINSCLMCKSLTKRGRMWYVTPDSPAWRDDEIRSLAF